MSVRIQITKPGIYDGKGKPIPVGTEITLKEEPKGWAGRYSVLADSKGKKTATGGPAADEQPPAAEFVAPTGPFTAKERSPGWWAIYDGKDEVVGKSVRKNDLDGFGTLSDDEKLAFATDHAKTAFEAEQKKA